MRRHGLARNPASAELVDRPSVGYTGEFDTLDPEQLAALVRAAETEQDAVLYLTAAQTGLRQGELLGAALARRRLRRRPHPRPTLAPGPARPAR